MIQFLNVSKSFGGQSLFKEANFSLGPGEKIGLVGRNGTGKSTLFKLVMGEIIADSGDIKIPKSYKIATLEQHIHFSFPTVLEECLSVLPTEEKFDHYKAEKILFGLGLLGEDMERDPHSFSGGQQIRIHLAKALLKEPNLLLLDEPTNYLDIVSLRWLKKFLRSYPGELIIITHDRQFMDDVVDGIIGISGKIVRKVRGNTRKYYEKVIEEEDLLEKTRLNQERKKKEMMVFVDRFRAKATKASQAQSRLKMIQKMDELQAFEKDIGFQLNFNYKEVASKYLMEVKNLAFSFDGKEFLFSDLDLQLEKGDCVAIIGKNGKGKSTLLNVLSGEYDANRGEVKFHGNVVLGHFGQTNVQRLHAENDVSQELRDANPSLTITQIRSICGVMGFTGAMAEKKIKVLSGGEKARVMLGRILAKACNVLFLDEPTNHLDMESVEVLTEAISMFDGGVVLVSHNEMLLKTLANKLIVFQGQRPFVFEGNYDEFLAKVGWEEEGKPVLEAPLKKDVPKQKTNKFEKIVEVGVDQEQMKKIENDITVLEKFIEMKNAEMVKASTQGDVSRIEGLAKEIHQIESKIDELFSKLEYMSH